MATGAARWTVGFRATFTAPAGTLTLYTGGGTPGGATFRVE
jgi:hypothetical protein